MAPVFSTLRLIIFSIGNIVGLFGFSISVVEWVCYLRQREELSLAALLLLDGPAEPGHQEGHLLGGSDYVVVLAGPLAHLLVQVVGCHHDRSLTKEKMRWKKYDY